MNRRGSPELRDQPDTPGTSRATTPADPLASWWLRVFPFLKRLKGTRPRTFYLLAVLPSAVLAAGRELLGLWILGIPAQRPVTWLEELGAEVWHWCIHVSVFAPIAAVVATPLLALLAPRIVRRPAPGRRWVLAAATWVAVLILSFAGLVVLLKLDGSVSIVLVLIWSIPTAHALAMAAIYHAQLAAVEEGRSKIPAQTLLWFGAAFFGIGLLGGLVPLIAGRTSAHPRPVPTGRGAEPIEPE